MVESGSCGCLRAGRRRRPSAKPQASARERFVNGSIGIVAKAWPGCTTAARGLARQRVHRLAQDAAEQPYVVAQRNVFFGDHAISTKPCPGGAQGRARAPGVLAILAILGRNPGRAGRDPSADPARCGAPFAAQARAGGEARRRGPCGRHFRRREALSGWSRRSPVGIDGKLGSAAAGSDGKDGPRNRPRNRLRRGTPRATRRTERNDRRPASITGTGVVLQSTRFRRAYRDALAARHRAATIETARSDSSAPSATPFSKSPSMRPIWFVTCATQSTSLPRALANA